MENKYIDDPDSILSSALDIGRLMLESGAEITRVEDTISRICHSYEMNRIDVFSITSLIVVSIQTKDNKNITQTRRIYSYSNNLYKLEELNSLSRYICKYKPHLSEIQTKLKDIDTHIYPKKWRLCVGSIIASSVFTIFFHGNIHDAITAGIIGIIIFMLNNFSKKRSTIPVVRTLICSFIAGLSSILLVKIGLGSNVDKIMIGTIMLLIPGIPTTNAIRDLLSGDIMSGFLRLIESVITAIAIACGFALSLIMLGGIL